MASRFLSLATQIHTTRRVCWLSATPMAAIGCKPGLSQHAVCGWMTRRCVWPLVYALGLMFCEEHDCPCGFKVDQMGSHGLSCRRGRGRLVRHDAINDIIYLALLKAQIPSQKEPRGLARDGSDKRVDGCTLIPWQRGRSMIWDVTIPDTLAHSHLPRTSAVWRRRRGSLTPKDLKIHWSEADI